MKTDDMRIAPVDLVAGLATIAVGALALWVASDYPFGKVNRMGPGYFPVVLSTILCALGAGMLVQGFRAGIAEAGEKFSGARVRSLIFVTASLIAFALVLQSAGLVLAIMVAVLLAVAAEDGFSLVRSLVLGIGLSAFCALVFVVGLGVPLQLFWWR